jgi:hypothetical protein
MIYRMPFVVLVIRENQVSTAFSHLIMFGLLL